MSTRFCENENVEVYELTDGDLGDLLHEAADLIGPGEWGTVTTSWFNDEPVVTVYLHA